MAQVEEEEPEGAPEWIVTFSDLVSLLVTLFIMMLAFSSQETHDLKRAMNIVKGSFGILGKDSREAPEMRKREQLQDNVTGGVRNYDSQEDKNLETRVRELQGFVAESDDLDKGMRIIPKALTSFAPGSDLPSVELADELRRLAYALRKNRKRRFRVEGFADPESDADSPVGDALALSLARARRATRILGLEGLPLEQIVVVARGNNAPRGELWTEEGQAQNRRVELVIEALSDAEKAARQASGEGR